MDMIKRILKYCILIGILSILCGQFFCTDSSKTESLANAAVVSEADSEKTHFKSALTDEISMSRQNAITQAVYRISPAVVGINVVRIQRYRSRSLFEDDPFWGWYFQPREYLKKVQGLGSGFIISPDGYILTNEHVVHHASEIVITTTDGKQYNAEKVGEDYTYDVALLKIDGDNLSYIPLGSSDDILIGEWVIALGNPFGLFDVSSKPTVTVGVVSAIGMNFQGDLEGRSYKEMIQTDAAINSGNSGGPLVNSLGECIGINAFIISGSEYKGTSIGIGFAIPVNRVKKILPELKTIGRVDRSFQTGLEVENVSWLVAAMLGISPNDGVIISRIIKNSPAEKAGLKVGDVIVTMNGERIRSTHDVQRIILSMDVTEDQNLKLSIFREGKLYTVNIKVDRSTS
jgi:serine protease Do